MNAAAIEADVRKELAVRSLRYMALMREAEERIERKLYRQGKIVGGVYVGRGQEAIPVGAGLAVGPDDVVCPSHRDFAIFLIRGVGLQEIFAQYMGREGGLTRGRDGNMHMGDMRRNIVAIISAMAASVPVAAGCALALKYKGTSNGALCFFGGGTTSRGDWHQGVNFAAVQKLPLILICNNNQYAYSTPLDKQMACANVADRGPGYGIPAEIVDGNDVLAVNEAGRRAVEHARAGLGPYLIECKTFRMTGHSAHDGADYVPKQLWEEWGAKDPISRLEHVMIEKHWADAADIDRMNGEITKEVDAALELPDNSHFPHPTKLLTGAT